MKTAILPALILAIAIGSINANSQEASAPLPQSSSSANLSALLASNDPANSLISAPLPSANPSSGFIRNGFVSRPTVAPVHTRVIDTGYIAVNALHLGMALFDVEMTQRCENRHTCREANPFMPSSQAGALSVSLGFVAYSATGSYFFKKHQKPAWWLPTMMGTAAHTLGVATGFAHQ